MNGPDGRRFPWGPIQHVHAIGTIEIVEFTWRAISNDPGMEGATGFAVYINGKDAGRTATTLDSAVVLAIATKRDGLNTQAAMFFDRMTLAAEPSVESS